MAFIRRCRDAGIAMHLLQFQNPAKRQKPTSAIASQGAAMPWSEVGTRAGLDRIVNFAHTVKADAICTADEFSLYWLAASRELFEPDCRIMSSPAASLERLMDKSEQTKIARDVGFQVLDSWLLHSAADLASIPAGAFPVCIRPTYMNSVLPPFRARRIESGQDLAAFLATLTWGASPFLVQTFCLGPNIVVHGVRNEDGAIAALQGFHAYRKYNGFALSMERCELPASVQESTSQFARVADIHGPFHFDLIQSAATGKIFFLEVNFRMGGTTAKVVRLGYDEPMMALAAFGLEPPRTPPPLRWRRRVTGKRMLVGQILSSFTHPPGELDFPQRTRWETAVSGMREMLSVPDALLSWGDVTGSLWYLRHGGR